MPSWRGAQLKHKEKFTFTLYFTFNYGTSETPAAPLEWLSLLMTPETIQSLSSFVHFRHGNFPLYFRTIWNVSTKEYGTDIRNTSSVSLTEQISSVLSGWNRRSYRALNFTPFEGSDKREVPPTTQKQATVPPPPLVWFIPDNAKYSASYALPKKTLLFMRSKNIIKTTYCPGFNLCILNRRTSNHQKMIWFHRKNSQLQNNSEIMCWLRKCVAQ